ncbi:alpha/beta-hydrolase [Coniochaeta ligniaria NRRL 30616]|uniref:Alpha/beta-hydrolase n=1 Tax=Coniochaeta ligniaria NRRL 30616 TaxID=1408157 RepID=A0A1J7ITL4_9PEZI|nr:alpha/beta-hydrolase [Coniochaeta ligniaria NRRL 30616]
MEHLRLTTAPPLDPAWLQFEAESGIAKPKPSLSILERQPLYAAACRALTQKMTAPGARDHHLSQAITTTSFTILSSTDGFAIPVLQLSRDTSTSDEGPSTTVIYIHGGGLAIGEADSEELTCRRIVADSGLANVSVYSIGYRLMPTYPATTCVSDCIDAFDGILSRAPTEAKVIVVGSSSGGELAALLAGRVGKSRIHGLALRCPVTSDAFTSLEEYVPQSFRELHTSTRDDSFVNCLLGKMVRVVPRDGLPYMPLEASEEELRGMPRTWIQVCSNDGLYSDGVCYAKALEEVGVEVKVDVVWGWPHTFWLKAPELDRALEAEREFLRALKWLAE